MRLVECESLVMIKDVPFPEGERFRDIIVTGPPGSGKTTLVTQLGGWSEEGYLDLAQKNWWRSEVLTFRPREVHFGFPFVGQKVSLAVFEKAWMDSPSRIDFRKVQIPPCKKGFLATDWSSKYVFYFMLPDPEVLYDLRRERAEMETHPVDTDLTLDRVRRQVSTYRDLAEYFHQNGLKVLVREAIQGNPKKFTED